MFYLWLDWIWGFGEKDHRGEEPFSTYGIGVAVTMMDHCWLWPWSLAEVVFAWFLFCKVAFSIVCSGKKSDEQSTLRSVQSCSTSLTEEYLHELYRTFLYQKSFLSVFPNWFIYSNFICISTDSCLFYTLVYNAVLHYLFCCLNCWALIIGSSFSWLLCFFDLPPAFSLLSISLLSVTTRCSRLNLDFPCLALESTVSPRIPGSFY